VFVLLVSANAVHVLSTHPEARVIREIRVPLETQRDPRDPRPVNALGIREIGVPQTH